MNNMNKIRCLQCNKKRSNKTINKYGICVHCVNDTQSEANAVRYYELFKEVSDSKQD